eukprot:g78747.t1
MFTVGSTVGHTNRLIVTIRQNLEKDSHRHESLLHITKPPLLFYSRRLSHILHHYGPANTVMHNSSQVSFHSPSPCRSFETLGPQRREAFHVVITTSV